MNAVIVADSTGPACSAATAESQQGSYQENGHYHLGFRYH